MNIHVSDALRYGTLAAMVIILIGLLMDSMGLAYSGDLLWFGILVLILSPMFGVIAAFICLAYDRETRWASVAAVLIAVTVAGVIVSFIV